MGRYPVRRLLCCAGLMLAMAPATAGEVKIQHDGLTLNADLTLADKKALRDGVILLTHGALAHRDMESLVYLRELLKEKGHNVLAINLSLGMNDRHGMYDCKQTHRHRNEDAAREIGAWLAWLKGQGATRITLLGHSRGGAQTALYAAEHNNPLVQSVVLLAPAIADNTSAATYQRRYGKALEPLLAQAQQQVAGGRGDTVIKQAGLMTCNDTPVTAMSLVSYYGPQAQVDTPRLLPKIAKPVLVVVAEKDQVVVGLDKLVAPLVDGKRVRMKVVEAADHLFRDLFADDAVEAIHEFMRAG